MKVSYQYISESGSFAPPRSKEVIRGFKKDAEILLDRWIEQHRRVGSEPDAARLLVYGGWTLDVEGSMPDWEVKRGPRGGTVWSRI